jgi:hypothetical protein
MATPFLHLLLAFACAEAHDDAAARTVARLNAYRKPAGLAPVELDAKLSKGCLAHAQYLARHFDPTRSSNFNPHLEDPKRAGYTREGDAAGKMSVIHFILGDADPAVAIDDLMAGFFHRMSIIRPDLKRVGFGMVKFGGNRRWIVIDTKSGREGGADVFRQPVFYPADKQKNVPVAFSQRETPNPIPPEGRKMKPGFPVTVMFPEAAKIEGVTALLKDAAGKEVAGWLSTPEKPAYRVESQYNAVCLIPKTRLRAGATYTATVTAKVDGKDWKRTWSFQTAGK